MGKLHHKIKKHYYFVGIGGIGMGAIASLVADQGHTVSGSDIRENDLTNQLKQKGAHIYLGHEKENIKGADVVVFSSAIDPNNPELTAAKEQEIPTVRRAELLAHLMQDQIGITIAGAHGKTTTTSMVSNLLVKADLQPTIAVGGIINDQKSVNAQLGSGNYFVAEVDESDGSFLNFTPKFSIITNIDREHLDYYKSWDNIKNAYKDFVHKTTIDGVLFVYGEDEELLNIIKSGNRTYRTYGFSTDNNIYAQDIHYGDFYSEFDCYEGQTKLGRVRLSVPGKHNIANALATISLGLELAIDFDCICLSLKEYKGVKRRFQLIDTVDDVLIVDDYAHHPTEIKTILSTAQHVKKKRLITIFQPHRYSRVKALMDEFVESLVNSDYLILTDIYAASEQPMEGITSQHLCDRIQSISQKPVHCVHKDSLVDNLLNIVEPGDMVMTLGAGDITKVAHQLAKSLKTINQPSLEVV